MTDDKRLKLHGLRGADRGRVTDVVLRTVCNYINSGFPVVASTREHTVTLIGWRRRGGAGEKIELVYSDSDRTYGILPASRVEQENWTALMIPLPDEVILTGESTQFEAHQALSDLPTFIANAVSKEGAALAEGAAAEIGRLLAEEKLSLRLQLKRRHEYRAAVRTHAASRGQEVAEALATMRLPSWVWVVEAQDREAREAGEDCVLAEFVFDTTSPDDSPQFAATSLGYLTWLEWPYDPRSIPAVREHERVSSEIRWRSQINASKAAQSAPRQVEAAPSR